jgi:hypothetical protein
MLQLHTPILGLVASISALVYMRGNLNGLSGTSGAFAVISQLISLIYKGQYLKYCNVAADLLESQLVNDLPKEDYH